MANSDAMPSGPASADPEAFATAAHAEAFEAMQPQLAAWFVLRFPTQSSIASGSTLSPPLLNEAREQRWGEQSKKLNTRLREIRKGALGPRDDRLHAVYQFALDRAAWWQGAGALHASDPHAYTRELDLWIDECLHRARFGLANEGLAQDLRAVIGTLRYANRHLGAMSPGAGLSGAQVATALAGKVRRLARSRPDVDKEAQALATALEAYAGSLRKLESELGSALAAGASVVEWDTKVGDGRFSGAPIPRPQLWGKVRTRDVLRNEEDWGVPDKLEELVGANLGRYAQMRKRFTVKPSNDAQRAVDAQRCTTLWEEFSPSLATEGVQDKLDCAVVVRELEGEMFTNAELAEFLLTRVFVPAVHRAMVRSRGGRLGAVWGAGQPFVALPMHVAMYGIKFGKHHAVQASLSQLQDQLCLGISALSLHGEVGVAADDLDSWLSSNCTQRTPVAWRKQAAADPRGSLAGLPAATLALDPASMANLAAYPWAPMGLGKMLAEPLDAKPEDVADESNQLGPPTDDPSGDANDAPQLDPPVQVIELTPN